MTAATIDIDIVPREVIFGLRWSMLRPGLPSESAVYPEDDNPEVFHVAARDGLTGELIGCATFFPEVLDGVPAWRFRGMATAESRRNQGIGGQVLEYGVAEAARRGATRVWCNGRSPARAFYERHDFTVVGDEFDLPPVGPHFVFIRSTA